jgi:hypothetical protein
VSITIVLYLMAFICFVLGAIKVSASIDWMLAGFACLTLTLIVR